MATNPNAFDPWQTLASVGGDIMAPLLVAVLISSVVGLLPFLKFVTGASTAFLLAIAFGLVGGTIGLFTGASQSPVVGAVLPALLTLVGGFVTYIIGKDTIKASDNAPAPDPNTKKFGITILIALSLSSVWMGFYGNAIRSTVCRNIETAAFERATTEKLVTHCLANPRDSFCKPVFEGIFK